jgi:hypothetical protein
MGGQDFIRLYTLNAIPAHLYLLRKVPEIEVNQHTTNLFLVIFCCERNHFFPHLLDSDDTHGTDADLLARARREVREGAQ